jgi:hypothetical protein
MQQREADLSLGRELVALGRLSEAAAALTVAVESQPDLHSDARELLCADG